MKKIEYPTNLDRWIVHFISGELTEEEEVFLQEWRAFSEENEALFQRLISEESCKREINKMAVNSWEEGWKQVQYKVARRKITRKLFRAGVAAIAVLTIGLSGLLWQIQPNNQKNIVQNETVRSGVRFSRSSGEVYYLDTLHKLALDHMSIEGNGRQMVVKVQPQATIKGPEMNMIEVPQGAEYSLVLADGTKVLLNSTTTFRFPDNFSGQESREVYLTGEAYFDVTSDSVHPFIVHTDQIFIKVLGTSFNVMAYPDLEVQQTTLVKGKVCVGENKTGNEVNLLSGMQASYHKTSGEIGKKEVDVSYYTAWKDGLFAFREQRLEDVMETLARWYGFEYFFQNPEARDYIYTGKVFRHEKLKDVLENFRLTEELDFNVNKNTVIINTKN